MQYAFVLGRICTLSIAELAAVLEQTNSSLGLLGEPVKLPPPRRGASDGERSDANASEAALVHTEALSSSSAKASADDPLYMSPGLGRSELERRWVKIIASSEEVLIIETSQRLNGEKLQKKLGGVIKILEIVDFVKKRRQDSLNFALKHYFKPGTLKKKFLKEYKGKIQIGLSIYLLDPLLAKPQIPQQKNQTISTNIFTEPKRIGMAIKKALVAAGFSARLVLPEFASLTLASVVVTKNLLLQKGAEVCILAGPEAIYVAKTLTVQDFEDYGRRDYQRPVRDEKQGMIPPKVAQIMLNLANCQPTDTILDPFCGIGTIIQEGLLLNFRMIGSDINKNAIKGSQQNLEWFRNRYKVAPGKYGLEVSDAVKISELIEKSGQKINAIVTECTLGPMYSQYPKQDEIARNFRDLEKLYIGSFKEFSKFLEPGKRIVMCVPAYKKGRDNYELFPTLDWAKDLGYDLVDLIPTKIAKQLKFLKLTERKTAIYDRKDQIVAREIVIFEKT